MTYICIGINIAICVQYIAAISIGDIFKYS